MAEMNAPIDHYSMPRHIDLPGYCYHVTSVTHGRRPLFADGRRARMMVDALHFVRPERALLLGYVVMPDHLRAALAPRTADNSASHADHQGIHL